MVAAQCQPFFKEAKMSSASFGAFYELFSVQEFGLAHIYFMVAAMRQASLSL